MHKIQKLFSLFLSLNILDVNFSNISLDETIYFTTTCPTIIKREINYEIPFDVNIGNPFYTIIGKNAINQIENKSLQSESRIYLNDPLKDESSIMTSHTIQNTLNRSDGMVNTNKISLNPYINRYSSNHVQEIKNLIINNYIESNNYKSSADIEEDSTMKIDSVTQKQNINSMTANTNNNKICGSKRTSSVMLEIGKILNTQKNLNADSLVNNNLNLNDLTCGFKADLLLKKRKIGKAENDNLTNQKDFDTTQSYNYMRNLQNFHIKHNI